MKQIKTGKRSHLSGTSTKKRSILFVSAKVTHYSIKSDRLEGLDARGDTFGDDNINFNLQQEKFGVDMAALKNVPVQSIFRVWVEDWEKGARKKNDCVTEALAKYKGLIFCNADTDLAFKVWEQTWSSGEEEEMVVGM